LTADTLIPAAAIRALEQAQTRLDEARALERAARDAYHAALRGPDPAAVRAARDRLSGIEVAIGQLHAAVAAAEHHARAASAEE
jgi:hypothetical protein